MGSPFYPNLANQSDPTAEEVYVLNHPDIQTRRWLSPGRFNDVNFARDWLQRSGIYDFTPTGQKARKGVSAG